MADADPVRVVVTPSQSSYFAGEPFSVTITFTNTRSPDPGPSRAVSHTHTHRRNAHSISSAPISRPPTSPGTPRTPRTAIQTPPPRPSREDARPSRKGLIGRTAGSPTEPTSPTGSLPELVELRRKKMLAKSLSVNIAPPDLELLSRNNNGPRTPRSASFVPDSPVSPPPPSSISRRSDALPLAASHPHARKQSILDGMHELVTSPISPSPISALPHTPSASSSTFSLALDSISEAAPTMFPYPPALSASPSVANPLPQLPALTTASASAPAAAYPPRRNSSAGAIPHTQLGLGHPPPLPVPPRTAHSASFTPPHTELLLYAYVALAGRAVLSPLTGAGTPALGALRGALLRPARGGGSLSLQAAGMGGSLGLGLGLPAGVALGGRHRRSSSFSAGLRAIGAGIGIWGRESGAAGGPSGAGLAQAPEDPEAPVPTLDVPPEMLAVDLALAPGESRSYTYTLLLPPHLPPTFKGRTLRFSYELVVGACRASGGSSVMKVPIRVYNNVVVGSSPRPYDLMWPVARRINAPPTPTSPSTPQPSPLPPKPTVTEQRPSAATAPKQAGNKAGSVADLVHYATRLMSAAAASPSSMEMLVEDGLGVGDEGNGLSGCREAVEMLTRNLKKVSYDITKDGVTVAVLTFPKSAFRLGETVNGVVEVNWRQGRGRVLQARLFLISCFDYADCSAAHSASGGARIAAERACHPAKHSRGRTILATRSCGAPRSVGLFLLDFQFLTYWHTDSSWGHSASALRWISPATVAPAFGVVAGDNGNAGGLEWKVRLCLLVGVANAESDAGTEGAGDAAHGEVHGARRQSSACSSVFPPPPSLPQSPTPPEKPAGWGAFFAASFLGGSEGGYHDGDDFDDDEGMEDGTAEEDIYGYDGVKSNPAGGVGVGVRYGGREEGWSEVKVEMVECVVPVRVWAGNTAFRAGDVVFNV
ncbi:Rgp1-domain-containing protein [Mycena sanguinolenta]|uniref:Rgp1-domain-containing protein n=1 Tax=Mycena sanguinolenta TaxID=230812 RepID=A0A8H7DLW0_9AGAR|nr:Rgp1-domain-containing protein [Mycena sanguinolenta]